MFHVECGLALAYVYWTLKNLKLGFSYMQQSSRREIQIININKPPYIVYATKKWCHITAMLARVGRYTLQQYC